MARYFYNMTGNALSLLKIQIALHPEQATFEPFLLSICLRSDRPSSSIVNSSHQFQDRCSTESQCGLPEGETHYDNGHSADRISSVY